MDGVCRFQLSEGDLGIARREPGGPDEHDHDVMNRLLSRSSKGDCRAEPEPPENERTAAEQRLC